VWEADQIVNVKTGGMKESKETLKKIFQNENGKAFVGRGS